MQKVSWGASCTVLCRKRNHDASDYSQMSSFFFFFLAFTWKRCSNGSFFVFYCNHFDFIVLHKLSDTEGRTASVWRERIGQWASDSDLLILCNCMMALILRGHRARCGAANRCPSALCCAQLWVTVCHRIIVLNASGQAPAATTFAVLSQRQKSSVKIFFLIEFLVVLLYSCTFQELIFCFLSIYLPNVSFSPSMK